MDLANKFTAVTRAKVPKIDAQELTSPRGYRLLKLKEIVSKQYGRCVVATIEIPSLPREDGAITYQVCFPRRFSEVLTSEYIDGYNEKPNLRLRFNGIGQAREYLFDLAESFAS